MIKSIRRLKKSCIPCHFAGILFRTLLLFMCVVTISCKTNSPLAKKADEFFQTKRYKRAVKQRDSLERVSESLKKDTAALGSALRNLKSDYAGLDNKYSLLGEQYKKLLNTSGAKLDKLSSELDNKSKELDLKAKKPT